MITTIFILAIFSFVVVFGTNAYTQFDKVMERQLESGLILVALATEAVNMTDEMKYLCIKSDASKSVEQIKDKEQQAQCKKFLDGVSIYELKELIDKFLKK
jgi:hypothetical protein